MNLENLYCCQCGESPKPNAELENNTGYCPECNDWTVYEVHEENIDKICGSLHDVFRRPMYNELYLPKNETGC